MSAVNRERSADHRVWVAAAPGGALLTVTQLGRGRWVPAVIAANGRARWRETRGEAQRYAEGRCVRGQPACAELIDRPWCP